MSLTDDELKAALEAYEGHGRSQTRAARALGLARKTFAHRLKRARQQHGSAQPSQACESCTELRVRDARISSLTKEFRRLEKENLTGEAVRRYIIGLPQSPPADPKWLTHTSTYIDAFPGVPSLLLSDFHWGETVDPIQVFGKNEYSLEIACNRLQRVSARTVDLLKNHMVRPEYPGIVILLGGDFLSGTIHDELTATNDRPLMPVFLDLYSNLVKFLETMIANFGRVMVFATAGGNHSRTTKKVPSKDKAYTNYDWLLYSLLEKHFLSREEIGFRVSDADSVHYRIYGHRYCLQHGDTFRGGSGFVGPFAPISRGDAKKRSAASSYGMNYDTLVLGHFHQLWMLNKIIVNGSLVGYNEYAIRCDFPYEPPKQALWLTHPKWGITFNVPVFADEVPDVPEQEWVSWRK